MHDLFKIKEVSEIHGAGPAHDSRTFVTLLFIPNGIFLHHRLNDVRDAIETLWRKFKKQNAPIHTEVLNAASLLKAEIS